MVHKPVLLQTSAAAAWSTAIGTAAPAVDVRIFACSLAGAVVLTLAAVRGRRDDERTARVIVTALAEAIRPDPRPERSQPRA